VRIHLSRLPKLLIERRLSAILGLFIIVAVWAMCAMTYYEEVQSDEISAARTNQNYALVFEENVLRSIGEIDKALLYLRHTVESRKDTVDFSTIVNTTDVLSDIIVQVAIIDAQGMMRASNAGPQPAPLVDLSDREHYKVHVHSSNDFLYMSKPVVGRVSHKWSVQFSRRFLNKDKSFGGVVVASLNPDHFTKFYNKIDFESSASISLIGSDGVVRSSGGSGDVYSLSDDLANSETMKHIRASENATFLDRGPATGAGRLTTIRKVSGHPLWVSVSTGNEDIYRDSSATLNYGVTIGIVLTLIVLAAMEQIFRVEARARQKADQLSLTLENMSQGIMLVTKDQQIPIINQRCADLLGLPAEFIKNPPRYDSLMQFGVETDDSRSQTPATFRAEQFAVDSSGVKVTERAMTNGSVIEIRRGDLSDGSFVQTFTDVTKRSRAEAHVAKLASEDPLTSLPNRRIFAEALDQIYEQKRSALPDSQQSNEFALLYIDLDRFKTINDTLGHRIGDQYLQEVARRLLAQVASDDLLARLGGDEFAIMVRSVRSRDFIEGLANRCIEAVAGPYEVESHRICSGASIGIAIGPVDGATSEDILVAADLALYSVKAGSRGIFQFYDPIMSRQVDDRRRIEMNLREAIASNQLQLYYQPIMNLQTGAVGGFEALARWTDPALGVVSPAEFIAVAEESALIITLGEWALREACAQAAKWPKKLNVAVNLSPIQFSGPNLADTVKRILRETGLEPHRLELEITERIFLAKSEETLAILHELKSLGVRISLDDFGTGYSALSYLRSFDFDKIFIDWCLL
jgi:diguanylate cyclase (GGDEF)-like protein